LDGDSLALGARSAAIMLQGHITAYNAAPIWREAVKQADRPDSPDLTGDGEVARQAYLSKLAASSRTEAVSRAGSLGLQ
jgi:hypothetical protein